MGIFPGLLISFFNDACQMFLVYIDLKGGECHAQCFTFQFVGLDRGQMFFDQGADCFFFHCGIGFHRDIEADKRTQVFAE